MLFNFLSAFAFPFYLYKKLTCKNEGSNSLEMLTGTGGQGAWDLSLGAIDELSPGK